MNNETMLNAVKSQKQKMEEELKSWKTQEEERKERISWCLNAPINKDTSIFLYEAGPCDHWDEWNDFSLFPMKIYKDEMELGSKTKFESPWKQIVTLERLVVNGLIHFADIFNQGMRGECLKYCFGRNKESEEIPYRPHHPVVALKVDNNGTCYAWSYQHDLEIPHDFDCEWELYDARRLQTGIR